MMRGAGQARSSARVRARSRASATVSQSITAGCRNDRTRVESPRVGRGAGRGGEQSYIEGARSRSGFQAARLPDLRLSVEEQCRIRDRSAILSRHLFADRGDAFADQQVGHSSLSPKDRRGNPLFPSFGLSK